ncbi:MAG: HAMP domain-containing protein [Candidatus Aminicenantes bacterium]|nr:HAMP domain-containing protein [Candidatus Aminicenantes bacterium]
MLRRRILISAAGIIGIFILLFAVETYISKISPVAGPSETLLLFFLWNIVIILFLALLVVLGRTFFKLYLERRNMVVGSKLKTKLVMFFFLFSLFPTIMFFIFSSDIIVRSVESWFKTPIDSVIKEIDSLSDEYYRSWEPYLLHYAKLIRKEIQNERGFNPIFSTVRRKMIEYNIDLVGVFEEETEIFTLLNPSLPLHAYRDVSSIALKKGVIGEDTCVIDRMEKGDIIRCIAASSRDSRYVVVVGKFIPQSVSQRVALVKSIVARYREMRLLSDPMKTTYILLLLLLSFLVLFASSWVGLHLARNITEPVERLLAGTEKLSRGDFSVKIDYKGSDEIGQLVEAFNRMVEELEKQKKEIEDRKNYIEVLLDAINPGVIGISSDGRIISANPSAKRLLGLKGEIGKPVEEAIRHDELVKVIKEGIKKGEPLESKEIILHSEDEAKHMVLNFVPIQGDGEIKGYIAVLEDITPIVNTQKMEVWREVATRVAHEIKNPLTPINLSAQRIISKVNSPSPDLKEIERAARTILSEIITIKSLAEDFSQMARMPQMRKIPYSLRKLLVELYDSYRSTYPQINFSLDVDNSLPEVLYFDPDQIKRAVRNLLNNAVEAVGEGDSIEVKAEIDLEKGVWRVEVSDTGPGIPDEDKPKIFNPYFSKKKGGSGLGLSIVMHIIKEHNGKIFVRDNSPRGAKFVIEVPI